MNVSNVSILMVAGIVLVVGLSQLTRIPKGTWSLMGKIALLLVILGSLVFGVGSCVVTCNRKDEKALKDKFDKMNKTIESNDGQYKLVEKIELPTTWDKTWWIGHGVKNGDRIKIRQNSKFPEKGEVWQVGLSSDVTEYLIVSDGPIKGDAK